MIKFPLAVVLFAGRREFRLRFILRRPVFDSRKHTTPDLLFGLVIGRDTDL